MKKIAKAKAGTSLGMKSVKAGYDSNPKVTRADIISAGKMKAGKAQNGKGVLKRDDYNKVFYNSALNAPALDQMVKNQNKPLAQKGMAPSKPAPKAGGIIKSTVTTKKSGGKAKNGTKVAAKKPIKKAQNGEKTKMVVDGKEYKEGSMLPEAVVTGKPIKSLKDRVKSVKDKVESIGDGLGLNRSYKPKPAKRSILSVKTYRQRGSGPGSGLMKLKQRITRRYKEGGEVEMAKKGASVKKAMGKCKMGC